MNFSGWVFLVSLIFLIKISLKVIEIYLIALVTQITLKN